jgi:hypothetical protein
LFLQGVAAALIMPICNTAAMNHHLSEISSQVAADAHAAVILDRAGWPYGTMACSTGARRRNITRTPKAGRRFTHDCRSRLKLSAYCCIG